VSFEALDDENGRVGKGLMNQQLEQCKTLVTMQGAEKMEQSELGLGNPWV
jgi:hypothetical protein